jgi:hypothetical protein
MATKAIKVLDAYVQHFQSVAKAPLTRVTNQQALIIFETLSVIDGLHAQLRQKVQNIQREKKRKVEALLDKTPSNSIIEANLRHIYGLKSSVEATSQIATRLRSSHPKVVRRWITTIPVGNWGNGEISTDIGFLAITKMETMENPDITTDELGVLEKASESDLQKSPGYISYYSNLLLIMLERVDLTE